MKVLSIDFRNPVVIPPKKSATNRVQSKTHDLDINQTKRMVKITSLKKGRDGSKDIVVPFENISVFVLDEDISGK